MDKQQKVEAHAVETGSRHDYYFKDRDTVYKGPVNDLGYQWDGDFEWYRRKGDTSTYRISLKADGTLECWYVLLGGGNVRVKAAVVVKFRAARLLAKRFCG